MILDELLPRWDFRERHEIRISARSAPVLAALRAVTPRELTVSRPLFALRGMRFERDRSWLDQMLARGFTVVGEEPGRELVIGAELGSVTAAVNFFAEEDGRYTRLSTETRVHAADARARRRFAAYWLAIRGGSGLIRRDLLRAARRRAER